MASHLRFEDSDGTTVFLESEKEDLSGSSGVQKVSLRGRLQDGAAVAQDSFERAVGQVLAVHARVFVNAVRGLEVPPGQAEITFGLKPAGRRGTS